MKTGNYRKGIPKIGDLIDEPHIPSFPLLIIGERYIPAGPDEVGTEFEVLNLKTKSTEFLSYYYITKHCWILT